MHNLRNKGQYKEIPFKTDEQIIMQSLDTYRLIWHFIAFVFVQDIKRTQDFFNNCDFSVANIYESL